MNKGSHDSSSLAGRLDTELIAFYADFCWKMVEFWFAWHTYWINLLQDRGSK
ncbi:MAG: hypothetical protein QXU32_04935 [Nitrososphaerales archaeon]